MARQLAPILMLVSCLSGSALAQDLLECVDPDVREGLLSQGFETDRVVSRAIPDTFRSMPTPPEFEFVVSSVSSMQTSAIYKTSQAANNALGTMLRALQDDGWNARGMPAATQGGFVNSAMPSFSMVCRDNETATVMSRESGTATFVNLSVSAGNASCQNMASPVAGMLGGSDIGLFMPRLSLPEGARMSGAAGGSFLAIGSSSSGTDRSRSTSMAIETEMTGQDLLAHFEQQLGDQGWTYESGWSSRASSGSAWSARPENGAQLSGLLDIVTTESAGYHGTFRAIRLD